ncbi:hypothetical protein BpHYR1_027322 [Brachionus plicatilis]|uniref:Protein-tyrosine sulfotransferase n=1 Tax=Brachionus plicatilis TaxID=10195 RepID=A0A3M7T5Q0_BRAPC|nr:hypothetical protein BpHYR1_027322 [Brachionus plicatilis]
MLRANSVYSKFLLIINIFILVIVLQKYFISKKSNPSVRYNDDLERIELFINRPHIFIGGSMSSGTSLLRSILDMHPQVKCGPETKFIQLILDFILNLQKNKKISKFIRAAGISNQILDDSIALAIYNVMLRNIQTDVGRLCNKEPSNAEHIEYLLKIFPKSKFILIIRDGREVSYSLLKRSKKKVNLSNFYKRLRYWDEMLKVSYNQCLNKGEKYCLMVRYEKLVTQPKSEIKKMVDFLDIEWTDKMLNHEKYVGTEIKISKKEWSKKGMEKKINSDSLQNWKGNIPGYNHTIVMDTFKMLKVLNYTD